MNNNPSANSEASDSPFNLNLSREGMQLLDRMNAYAILHQTPNTKPSFLHMLASKIVSSSFQNPRLSSPPEVAAGLQVYDIAVFDLGFF